MHRPDRLRVLGRANRNSLAALLLLAAGCGGGGERNTRVATAPVVRDSAGVRIVVNRVPDTGLAVYATPSAAPTLVVGAGSDAPGEPAGVLTLPGGRLAVADDSAREVRFFDAGGDFITAVGGPGGGSGGFQSVSRIGLVAGDTLWVADHRAGELVLVTPGGEVARHAFPRGLTVAGRFADDGYLMIPQWSPSLLEKDWVEGVRRDSASWGLWWPRSVAAAQTLDFPHDELMVLKGPDGPVAAVPPFGRRTSRVVAPDGFFQGDQVTFEIRRHRPDGTLVGILRLEGVALTLSEALKSSVRPPRSEGDTALVDRLWKGVPRTRPAYTRLLLDSEGNLWVAEHVAGNQPPRNWIVFSPEWAALGAVTLAPGFEPMEIGPDYMLGFQGEPEARRAVKYGLTRRG